LGEVVEAVLPDDEVVLSLRIVDEGAGYAFFVAECLELGAVVHQSVCTSANHPQELVLFLHLVGVGDELCGSLCVGC